MRSPPSGIPFFAVIFRMSLPAFSLICSMRAWAGPNPDQRSLILPPVAADTQDPGGWHLSGKSASHLCSSIARQGWVYVFDPGQDTPHQVGRAAEPPIAEQ